jgi:hypothetical protein
MPLGPSRPGPRPSPRRTVARPPEQLLSDIDANVEQYVNLVLGNRDPWTTPQLMAMALDASHRRPELLALLFATTLQKLATERAVNRLARR